MTKITIDRYMSTNDFVHKNELQKQADWLFGEGWEAEDDVEQIEKLCDHVSPNKYMVSSIHGLKYEDDIEVREIDGLTTKEDIMNFCHNLSNIITKKIKGDSNGKLSPGLTGRIRHEDTDFYVSVYSEIHDYIDKNYILNFVEK